MNIGHRFADGVRSFVGYWTPTNTSSNFRTKGTLTPQEFSEAGDQLAFKYPAWSWQVSSSVKFSVPWLSADKQYLVTKNVPCRRRVADLDQSKAFQVDDGWLFAGRDPTDAAGPSGNNSVFVEDFAAARAAAAAQKQMPGATSTDAAAQGASEQPTEGGEASTASASQKASPSEEQPPSATGICKATDSTETGNNAMAAATGGAKGDDVVDLSSFQEVDVLLGDNGGPLVVVSHPAGTKQSDETKMSAAVDDLPFERIRSYDISITYDKYYQTPRIWLFGYDENGIPLTPDKIVEDVLGDYVAKTVTVDPHPHTGVPTVSIHPCKHAEAMKKVVDGWIAGGIEPRHDLTLFVLLKFIASAVPTIEYDFTMSVDMLPPP